MTTLLTAAHVATVAGPILVDAAVVFEQGVISAVGPARELLPRHRDARRIDLGDSVLLPGLVNAHAHLELTLLGQLKRPENFVDWVLDLMAAMSAHADRDAFAAASTAAGVGQCLRFGVTSVGDISSSPAATRRVLGGSPLRGVSFGEVLGTGSAADERLIAALDRSADSGRLRAGIEPHAPYTVDLGTYRRCLAEARSVDVPLATHLAETPDEAEFLASGTGEFARLWTTLRGHVPEFTRSQCGPIRAMEAIGLLDSPAVLAHVNYASDEELELLARGRASVAYCPRTHEYFAHPPHRFEDMLAAGINVAVGADSVASSPDLNLLDDLRLIHRGRPHVPVETLVEMGTIRGARALGMAHRIGTIEPGKSADFCAFKVTSSDPLREVLETRVLPDRVWIGGETVYAAAPAP